VDSFSSTSSTRRLTSDEWTVPPPLVVPLFRSNTTGGISVGETVHSLEVIRRVLLVERELPTHSSSSTSSTRRITSEEWSVPPPLVAPIVLLLTSGQFLLH
jgi:hypothetical protein